MRPRVRTLLCLLVALPVLGLLAIPARADVPVAVDDQATTPEDSSVIIDVLANDSDPDGDTLSIDLSASVASDGSVSDNGDGTLTYTPGQDFNGTDGFDYNVDDGHDGVATGHVAVTVTPVNDAPIGVVDTYSFTTATLSTTHPTGVLANDADVDGPALHAALVTGPALATAFTLHDDGSFTYTPAANVCQRNDGFTYVVSDGSLQSPPVEVSLRVRIPRQPATMTLATATPTVDYHGSATLTARLSSFRHGVKVVITRTPLGGAPIPVLTKTPDALGRVKVTVAGLLKRNTFTATSEFDNCHVVSTHQTVVLVRASVIGALTGGTVIHGIRTYHAVNPFFSTKVTPAHPGGSVQWVWQTKQGGVWKNYFTPTVTLDDDSAAGFGLAGWTPNVLNRIRAVWNGDATNARSWSAWLLFRVLPA
jgi:Cadherin-like domain